LCKNEGSQIPVEEYKNHIMPGKKKKSAARWEYTQKRKTIRRCNQQGAQFLTGRCQHIKALSEWGGEGRL